MRIRSIKPEFWRSPDTVELDMFTRLLFVGLWNYVDDNGVGEDDVSLIRSDLFPRDTNVDELSVSVHRGLTELARRGHITRYLAAKSGRRYFKVVAWHHQKINRPTESKKPLPTSEDTYLNEDSVSDHGDLTDDSLPDLGSKGSRDQGVEGPPYPPHDELSAELVPLRKTGTDRVLAKYSKLSARSAPAHQIAQAFSESLPNPIQSDVLSEIAVQIDKCLTDAIPPEAIAHGIHDWANSDSWSPTQIPRFVAKATAKAGSHGKATRKALDYDAAAEQLIAELGSIA